MSQYEKTPWMVLSGSRDKNISFSDLCMVMSKLGFDHRIRGDHFIFTKDGVEEIVNIQPNGSKAKPYQVKQIREIILNYHLGGLTK